MALKTRVWSAGKLVLLAGALVATYLIFAAAAMRIALRTREVQVPDFTNKTANEATSIAADLGLAMKIDDTRPPDQKVAAGRVIAACSSSRFIGPRFSTRPCRASASGRCASAGP